MEFQFLLFDGRYKTNPDIAFCFEVCDTFREAVDSAPDYGDDVYIVRFETTNYNELVNPKIMNDGSL